MRRSAAKGAGGRGEFRWEILWPRLALVNKISGERFPTRFKEYDATNALRPGRPSEVRVSCGAREAVLFHGVMDVGDGEGYPYHDLLPQVALSVKIDDVDVFDGHLSYASKLTPLTERTISPDKCLFGAFDLGAFDKIETRLDPDLPDSQIGYFLADGTLIKARLGGLPKALAGVDMRLVLAVYESESPP